MNTRSPAEVSARVELYLSGSSRVTPFVRDESGGSDTLLT